MHSLRFKFTLFTVLIVLICSMAIGLVGIRSIIEDSDRNAEQLLALTSDNSQQSLDLYLKSIEQSVNTVANFADDDAKGLDDETVQDHISRVETLFDSVAENTNGILTYYYRLDPELVDDEVGFWAQLRRDKFVKADTLTPIRDYDPDDVEHVGWFTIPKETGKALWLDPYFNKNFGKRMISYVAPIYADGEFIGVLGIDFSYDKIANRVKDIRVYKSGYAFLTDDSDHVIYHPDYETGSNAEEISSALIGNNTEPGTVIIYNYKGVKKHAVCSELSNGMKLYVTVPESEINSRLYALIREIILISLLVLAASIIVISLFVKNLTKPLTRLTQAAKEIDEGNYEFTPEYTGNDEIGILTNAFGQLTDHLRSHINDLNMMAYRDSLTSVRNKSAFDLFKKQMDEMISRNPEDVPAFAVCMLDCNDLKGINDTYGHAYGDTYLVTACKLICDIFRHSPVFRIGGDEFVAVLENNDYRNYDLLNKVFDRKVSEINAATDKPWERVNIAKGISLFDPANDTCVDDVLKRADELMYIEKSRQKAQNTN